MAENLGDQSKLQPKWDDAGLDATLKQMGFQSGVGALKPGAQDNLMNWLNFNYVTTPEQAQPLILQFLRGKAPPLPMPGRPFK